jgi:hypothetical protein
MGESIVKQPNGRYARYSSIVDDFTDINMTEDDYIELCVVSEKENAIRDAKITLEYHVCKMEEVIEEWRFMNLGDENVHPEDKPEKERYLDWLLQQMATTSNIKWRKL